MTILEIAETIFYCAMAFLSILFILGLIIDAIVNMVRDKIQKERAEEEEATDFEERIMDKLDSIAEAIVLDRISVSAEVHTNCPCSEEEK